MIAAVVVIHIVVCLTLVVVVLLQQGKGADVGAVFGGSSQTLFGSSGAGNLLTKVTGFCTAIFFATSLILAYSSSHRATGSIFEGSHLPVSAAPAKGNTSGGLPAGVATPSQRPAAPSKDK